jgi:hypothetical protein
MMAAHCEWCSPARWLVLGCWYSLQGCRALATWCSRLDWLLKSDGALYKLGSFLPAGTLISIGCSMLMDLSAMVARTRCLVLSSRLATHLWWCSQLVWLAPIYWCFQFAWLVLLVWRSRFGWLLISDGALRIRWLLSSYGALCMNGSLGLSGALGTNGSFLYFGALAYDDSFLLYGALLVRGSRYCIVSII